MVETASVPRPAVAALRRRSALGGRDHFERPRAHCGTRTRELDPKEAISTPTGRLRPGYVRVAGVATEEVKLELLTLVLDRGLRSLSQAVGAALEEWLATRRKGGVQPREPSDSAPGSLPARVGVLRTLQAAEEPR